MVDSCFLRRLAVWLRRRCWDLERLMLGVLVSGFAYVWSVVFLLALMMSSATATVMPTTIYIFRGSLTSDPPSSANAGTACASYAAAILASDQAAFPGPRFGWASKSSSISGTPPNYECTVTLSQIDNYYGDGSYHDYDGGTTGNSHSSACPANSYGVDSCVCNAGFSDNGANACNAVPNCKAAGTTLSSGYYDTGTSMASGPKVLVCSGGCQAIFDGTYPAGSAKVGSATHYYAKGSYHAADGTCSPSDTPSIGVAPTSNTAVPQDKCDVGQVAGTINGRATCVSGSTGAGTVSTVPGTTSTSGTTVAQNVDGSSDSTTTTTTSAPDGSTSTTSSVAHTNANGTSGGTTTTTSGTGATNGTGASGSANTGGATGSNTTPDDGSNPCKTNPAGSGCGGTPGDVPSFWTAKDKTVATVLTNAKNTLMSSGIGSGVTNFFTVQEGGTCPPSTWAIAYFHTTISVGTFCTDFAAQMFLVIRGVLLLVASFMAFRAAIE